MFSTFDSNLFTILLSKKQNLHEKFGIGKIFTFFLKEVSYFHQGPKYSENSNTVVKYIFAV